MFFLKMILFGTSGDGEFEHLSLLLTETLKGFVSGYRRLFWQDALREYQSSAQVFTFVWKFGGLSFGFESSRKTNKKRDLELPWEK